MEIVLSVCLGLGLSAACGFRVFVPLLITSLAAFTGHLSLSSGFQWIGSYPALIAFSAATLLEICGYYIPWVDHFLDSLATPAAVVAGTILTASFVTNVSPFLKWTLAVIAGGGAAGLVQASTVLARGASTVTTGGLANPVFATAELGGSIIMSLLSIVAPVLTALLVLVVVALAARKLIQLRTRRSPVIAATLTCAQSPR
jgi:hypothetical protein